MSGDASAAGGPRIEAQAVEMRIAGLRLLDAVAAPGGGTGIPVPVSMTIINRGPSPDRLVQASSPVAARIEIQAAPHPGQGVARRSGSGIDVPSGRTVTIGGGGPQGGRLLLTGVRKPLVPGQTFPLALTFAHAGRVELTVVVGAGTP